MGWPLPGRGGTTDFPSTPGNRFGTASSVRRTATSSHSSCTSKSLVRRSITQMSHTTVSFYRRDRRAQDITCRRSSGRATASSTTPAKPSARSRNSKTISSAAISRTQSPTPFLERFVELSHDDEDDADNGRLFVIKGAIAEYPAEAIDAAFSNFDWFTRRALQRLRAALARTREATP